jgi:hypothetical protein
MQSKLTAPYTRREENLAVILAKARISLPLVSTELPAAMRRTACRSIDVSAAKAGISLRCYLAMAHRQEKEILTFVRMTRRSMSSQLGTARSAAWIRPSPVL